MILIWGTFFFLSAVLSVDGVYGEGCLLDTKEKRKSLNECASGLVPHISKKYA